MISTKIYFQTAAIGGTSKNNLHVWHADIRELRVLLFYLEKPVKEVQSRAWICFFIRMCEKLIFGAFFQACAKFAQKLPKIIENIGCNKTNIRPKISKSKFYLIHSFGT